MKKLFLNGLMTIILSLFFMSEAHSQDFYVDITVVKSPSCHGDLGELGTNVIGGTAPYTYQWFSTVDDGLIGTDPTLGNVQPAGYWLFVTDALGQIYHDSIGLGFGNATAYTTAAHCPTADGSATVEYYGSHALPITTIWSNGETGQTVTGLAAGELITVTATDANGCAIAFVDYENERYTQTTSKTLEIGSEASFTADYQYTPATCTRPDGYAKVTATGTTGPYTYIWKTSPVRTGQEQSGLTSDYYTVRIKDNMGCFLDYTFYLESTSGPLSGSVYTTQNEYCHRNDGAVALYVNGGTTPYTISWATGQTGVTSLSNLSSGYYSVTVKDAENCKITKQTYVNRYSPMTAKLMTVAADCNNEHGAINSMVTGGTLPYTYSWSNRATTQNISELGIGWYTLLATDAEGCIANQQVNLFTEPGCQGNIYGVIYQDNNNNCIKDAGEPVIYNQSINASNTTTHYGMYDASDATGSYLLRYPYNGTYELNSYSSSPYYISQCPVNGTTKNVTAPNNYIHDIGMVPVAIGPDLQTSVYSTWVRPGFSYNYDVFVRNVGTEALSNGTVEIQLDGMENLVGFVDYPASYDPVTNTVVYDINNLGINEAVHFNFNCMVDPTTLLNTHFNVTAVAYPLSGDLEESTNTYTLKQTVVGSYDPNDIQSFKTGDLTLGEDTALTYHIRFQNTGTFYAEFVVVRDTLDAKLDPATLRDVQSSHPVSVTFLDENVVEFVFNDIFLQDSTSNEAESHGFVNYKIDLKENIIAGDVIPNSAAIYFDYNAPVLTNEVNNRVANPTGILNGTDTKRTALVFPNPAHDQASFKFPETMRSFELLNAVGSVVYSTQPDQNTVEVKLTGWKGMHYYRATNAKGEMYSGKIVIE